MPTTVGENIQVEVQGNILTLRIDMSQDFGPSASGKTNIVASTRGNVTIPGTNVTIGVNAYKRRR